MNELEQLQQQIDNLRATVERLQSGESKIVSMPKRIQAVRRETFEKYYGTWGHGRGTPIGANENERCTDRTELSEGLKRLTNIVFKSIRGKSEKLITTVINGDNDLNEYAKLYDYFCKLSYDKIKMETDNLVGGENID